MPRSRATQSTELVAVRVEWATRRRSAATAARVGACSITIKATSAVICAHLARVDRRRVLFISGPPCSELYRIATKRVKSGLAGIVGYLTARSQRLFRLDNYPMNRNCISLHLIYQRVQLSVYS